jgi:hypothetical protein
MSSITLAAIALRWARQRGFYLAVGSADIIGAALKLGFPCEPCRAPSNVVMIGISRRDVNRLRTDTAQIEVAALTKSLR